MENLAYIDETWEELLDGKIVAMSPRPAANHNFTAENIHWIFKNYLRGNKPCRAIIDGIDVHLTEKDIVVPDVMIVCNMDIVKKDGIHGVPDLIVEVLSPATAKNDKGYKKDLYEKCGVKEYWIVDTENRSIEVYLLENNKYTLDNVYSIYPDYIIAKMKEEEKAAIIHEFRTSLFNDLVVKLEDVFEGLL